jgi:hypothetical protein
MIQVVNASGVVAGRGPLTPNGPRGPGGRHRGIGSSKVGETGTAAPPTTWVSSCSDSCFERMPV